MGKRVAAVDFDGVVHSYKRGWTDVVPLDPPMEGVEEGLKALIEMGFTLRIFTTRPVEYVQPWLVKYGLDKYFSGISNQKFPATVYIDDRGLRFENWPATINIMNQLFPPKKA